nr:hypothetical protein [Aquitalea magnusonii]
MKGEAVVAFVVLKGARPEGDQAGLGTGLGGQPLGVDAHRHRHIRQPCR